MKRELGLIVMGISFVLGGCANSTRQFDAAPIVMPFERKRATWVRYGENVIYKDFNKIDFSSIPKENIELPEDLADHIRIALPQLEDPEGFEQLVLAEAEKLNWSKEELKNLKPKDAILLSRDIVTSRMNFHYVDDEDSFIDKHGRFLPIDRYFKLGLGDCDKFARSFAWVFRILNKYNTQINNIYVADNHLGGLLINHAWNCFLIPMHNKLVVTHVDPTRYEIYGEFHATLEIHVSGDKNEFLAQFYKAIHDFETSYEMYKRMFNEGSIVGKKAKILAEMAYAATQLKDIYRMEDVRERFLQLGTKKRMDDILYYSYRCYKYIGNVKLAEEMKTTLLREYPTSFWSNLLRSHSG